MKDVKIASVKYEGTTTENSKYCVTTKTVARWTFTNKCKISIIRYVMDFGSNIYKDIIITPVSGFDLPYIEMAKALKAAEKAANATFPKWNVNIRL